MSIEQYWAPQTLPEALEHLRTQDVTILAGGTDLLVQMRAGAPSPGILVDVKRIAEMTGIEQTADGGFRIGAAVCGAAIGAGVLGSATVGAVGGVGATVVDAATGGVIVIVGASCAKAAGVDRTRNAAIALVAGRERAIFFIIVNDERTAGAKCCSVTCLSGTSRGYRTARRSFGK